ncbi:hypothetical protein BCON_0207g00110 [Botryotinia convoluta]|uniref:Uncharacterized protein n=1 Tax=Botryotinia convoluta TaxID=54673 RepID=A0A4Z1HQE9_9HELO|nr:hypothetical protein BCON_0207g00110 [Botryotinia convoluta]
MVVQQKSAAIVDVALAHVDPLRVEKKKLEREKLCLVVSESFLTPQRTNVGWREESFRQHVLASNKINPWVSLEQRNFNHGRLIWEKKYRLKLSSLGLEGYGKEKRKDSDIPLLNVILELLEVM